VSKIKYMAVCMVSFVIVGATSMANLITNGDVENGTNNWTIVQEAGSSIATNASAQSPFSTGVAGMLYTDAAASGAAGTPYSYLGFGTQPNGRYTFKFDYKVESTSGGSWTCRIYNNGVNEIPFAFTISGTQISLGATSGNTLVATGLKSNEWYHVEIGLDTVNQRYTSFSLVNTNGTVNKTYGELAAYTTVTPDGLNRLSVVDVAANTVANPLYLDNVQLIPEPATIGMLGLGALVVLLVRRQINA
jgi:hypothetical protein